MVLLYAITPFQSKITKGPRRDLPDRRLHKFLRYDHQGQYNRIQESCQRSLFSISDSAQNTHPIYPPIHAGKTEAHGYASAIGRPHSQHPSG